MDFLPLVFTLRFLEVFITGLFMISPIILFFLGLLFLFAKLTCRHEKWGSYSKSLYFTMITALTVGYGQTVPRTSKGRLLSVFSGITGIILGGLIVSVALNAVVISWGELHDSPIENSIEAELETLEGSAFRGSSPH